MISQPVYDLISKYNFTGVDKLLHAWQKEKTLPAYCVTCDEEQGEDKRWTEAKHCPDCGCNSIYTLETLNIKFKPLGRRV